MGALGKSTVVVRIAYCPSSLCRLALLSGYSGVTRICTAGTGWRLCVSVHWLRTTDRPPGSAGLGVTEIVPSYVRWRTVKLCKRGGECDGHEGKSNSMARPPTRRDPMSIRSIEKKVAFGRTFAFGESDEVTPTDASNEATDEPNASVKREQADRQALERAEDEGMSGHPD
jgi:hypothetical protein